ncbi:hypothetical protein NXS98_07645 [Fontisphaera persica]|uniref:hypothetical protein n=1 Tax=Fontisphaera persica TaxID=2974023 RepID=UPI0024BFC69A|nr:hypothetical protein [Fontisphaera persica]WCJ60982.1 hypothetical protein NXS98_07645 [Fontisphaera persica]
MKTFGLILIAGITLLLTAYAAEHLQITTKKQSFPEKQLSVERTYRGNQCIVLEMTEGGKRTRAFRVNGKTVMAESDEEGDGFLKASWCLILEPKISNGSLEQRTTSCVQLRRKNFKKPSLRKRLPTKRFRPDR